MHTPEYNSADYAALTGNLLPGNQPGQYLTNDPALARPGGPGIGHINTYTCPNGHQLVTVDRAVGVTPMKLTCSEPGCGLDRTSAFYNCDQTLTPTHEWYRPGRRQKLVKAFREHVHNGGLLIREIGDEAPPMGTSHAPAKGWKKRIEQMRKRNGALA